MCKCEVVGSCGCCGQEAACGDGTGTGFGIHVFLGVALNDAIKQSMAILRLNCSIKECPHRRDFFDIENAFCELMAMKKASCKCSGGDLPGPFNLFFFWQGQEDK